MSLELELSCRGAVAPAAPPTCCITTKMNNDENYLGEESSSRSDSDRIGVQKRPTTTNARGKQKRPLKRHGEMSKYEQETGETSELLQRTDSPSWKLEPSHWREKAQKEVDNLQPSAKQKRSVLEYYERQNAVVKGFLDLDDQMNQMFSGIVFVLHFSLLKSSRKLIKILKNHAKHFSLQGGWSERNPGKDGEGHTKRSSNYWIKTAIYASFVMNIVLFIAKVIAAALTGSLAVIASALDSFLDLFSGAILFVTTYYMQRDNPYMYPAGKSRMEPIGIIAFSSVMFTATLMLMIESVQVLVTHTDETLTLDTLSLVILIGVVIVKALLYAYCRWVLHTYKSGSVKALAQDHRNDVMTNCVGAAAAILAVYINGAWWVDAVGAMLIALFLMVSWGRTGWEHTSMLAGKSASPEFLGNLTYVCWNHDERILAIDTVRAFHLSFGYLVEVDVVLPPDMMLEIAHDIGEELQFKLERIPDVERAFVHLDYEVTHRPEHMGGVPHHILKRSQSDTVEEDGRRKLSKSHARRRPKRQKKHSSRASP